MDGLDLPEPLASLDLLDHLADLDYKDGLDHQDHLGRLDPLDFLAPQEQLVSQVHLGSLAEPDHKDPVVCQVIIYYF